LPPSVKLRAVRVEEVEPPEGVEPILWILLTTHAVASVEDALRIVSWYRARWTIEQVFRTMKSQGFDLEQSQIETPQVMAKLILAVLIAAWRTMQLVYARSGTTGQKLGDAMDETAETAGRSPHRQARRQDRQVKKSARQRNVGAPFLGRWAIGRLGRIRRHGYKPAGPITIGSRPRPLRRHPGGLGDAQRSVTPLGYALRRHLPEPGPLTPPADGAAKSPAPGVGKVSGIRA
jgi:hypothetical protein